MTIIALLVGLSVPVYQSFQVKNDLDIVSSNFRQSVHRAQLLSQAVYHDSQWGVHVGTSTITLFRGASYASRITNYDEEYNLPQAIYLSGDSEVVFSKVYGYTSSTKTFTFTSTTGESVTLNVNTKGTVE